MLKINRIKAISRTDGGEYGFDYTLSAGLNLISSAENTKGKSSAILAMNLTIRYHWQSRQNSAMIISV